MDYGKTMELRTSYEAGFPDFIELMESSILKDRVDDLEIIHPQKYRMKYLGLPVSVRVTGFSEYCEHEGSMFYVECRNRKYYCKDFDEVEYTVLTLLPY